jgi:hypothetical protein
MNLIVGVAQSLPITAESHVESIDLADQGIDVGWPRNIDTYETGAPPLQPGDGGNDEGWPIIQLQPPRGTSGLSKSIPNRRGPNFLDIGIHFWGVN